VIKRLTRRDFGKVVGTVAFGASTMSPAPTPIQAASPDDRARMTEQQMTDDERFSLLISVMGRNNFDPVHDKRIPDEVPMSAGYTPGVPRRIARAKPVTDRRRRAAAISRRVKAVRSYSNLNVR
jgi:hypothetical protein